MAYVWPAWALKTRPAWIELESMRNHSKQVKNVLGESALSIRSLQIQSGRQNERSRTLCHPGALAWMAAIAMIGAAQNEKAAAIAR